MNTTIFYFFYNLAHKSTMFDQAMIFITDKLDALVLLAAVVYLFYFFASHPHWKEKKLRARIWECITVFVSTTGAYAVSYILKIIFYAPRPFVTHLDVQPLVSETWYSSFPSGHATLFFALATSIYLYDKRAGVTFFVVAVIIALSRMIVGVHYPVDILAGAVIGIVVAWILHRYILKFMSTIFSNKNL